MIPSIYNRVEESMDQALIIASTLYQLNPSHYLNHSTFITDRKYLNDR